MSYMILLSYKIWYCLSYYITWSLCHIRSHAPFEKGIMLSCFNFWRRKEREGTYYCTVIFEDVKRYVIIVLWFLKEKWKGWYHRASTFEGETKDMTSLCFNFLRRKEKDYIIALWFLKEKRKRWCYCASIFKGEKKGMILSHFDLASVAGSQYPET